MRRWRRKGGDHEEIMRRDDEMSEEIEGVIVEEVGVERGAGLKLVKIPRREDGELVWGSMVPRVEEVRAQRPGEAGSLDWVLDRSFDGRLEALGWLEGMVDGGEELEAPIGRMCVAARVWEERGEGWDWNKAAKWAGVRAEEVLRELGRGMREMTRMVGLIRVARSQGEVLEAAIETAKMIGREGLGDRKMLLEVLGLVEGEGGGVNVSVNQQMGVKFDGGLKGGGLVALKQFVEVEREMDGRVRDGEGEGVEDV